MCVIIFSPSGSVPKDHVINAMVAHPHGWGFSVAHRGAIRTYKTTDFKQFFKAWHGRVKGPTLFHARWATHGSTCRDNCHPFKVRRHNLVAAHNGILRGFGVGDKSDTRDFIERVVEPMYEGFLGDPEIVKSMEEWIGGSKIAFMDRNGRTTILNDHLGVWVGGRWYSNSTAF